MEVGEGSDSDFVPLVIALSVGLVALFLVAVAAAVVIRRRRLNSTTTELYQRGWARAPRNLPHRRRPHWTTHADSRPRPVSNPYQIPRRRPIPRQAYAYPRYVGDRAARPFTFALQPTSSPYRAWA